MSSIELLSSPHRPNSYRSDNHHSVSFEWTELMSVGTEPSIVRKLGIPSLILIASICVALICASQTSHGADQPAKAAVATHKHTNRLARESSPYLLLHAHNPVDWYPWGPEALERAKQENKPIFLSIGYTSCYWCHVMERQVFENEEIAAYLNEHFVCIKVDREERPDIDELYMLCLQVYLQLAGSNQGGGWPLSIFLTPEGKPIAGGTYFPPTDMPGRPGFMTILKNVTSAWTERQADVISTSELIAKEVKRLSVPQLVLQPVALNSAIVAKSIDAINSSYDPEHGGFDFSKDAADAPKFPIPARLELLQTIGPFAETAEELMRKLDFTLTRMEQGGIRDHLGGGFHRYSTDRIWLVPHFEKMLYDNAQLASVYTRAYARTSLKSFRQVAESTLDFLLRDLLDPEGGFHSALDAETNGVEGQHYVWSADEIATILTPEEYPIAESVYGLKEKSPFEAGTVLHLSKSIPDAAELLQLPVGELETKLSEINSKLLAARKKRPALLKDDKVLVGWNGLAIQAFAEAGQTFQRRDYTDAAERAANFILQKVRSSDGLLLHVSRGGEAKVPAYLEDYAALVSGLLALHQSTEDERWLKESVRLTDEMIEQCSDDRGGFFLTSKRHDELLARPKNSYDSVIPSGNSLAVRNLVRLAKLTGNTRYRDSASKTLETFASQLEATPAGHACLAVGLAEYLATYGDSGTNTNLTGGTGSRGTPAPANPDPKPAAPDTTTENTPSVVFATPSAEEQLKHPLIQAEALIAEGGFAPGSECPVVVRIKIKEGWHINANPARPKFLKATELKGEFMNGSLLSKVTYPPGTDIKSEGVEEPISVYEGTVELKTAITVPENISSDSELVTLTIRYQACNEKECQAPMRLILKGKLSVGAGK